MVSGADILVIALMSSAVGALVVLIVLWAFTEPVDDRDPELRRDASATSHARHARPEAAQWVNEGLLVDVITEVYRQLREEKLRQTQKEDSHGTDASTAATNRA